MLPAGRQGLVHRHRQQPPVGKPAREHPHAGVVEAGERAPRRDRRQPGPVRLLHQVMHLPLRRAELTRRRKRPRHVRRVQRVRLDPHVEEHQVRRQHRPVAAHPVQGRRVLAAAHDGRVAGAVPVGAGVPVERALQPPLPAAIDRGFQLPGHRGEPRHRVVHRRTQLADLPLVFDQAQPRQDLGDGRRRRESVRRSKCRQGAHLDAEGGRPVVQPGGGADPQFAVGGVGEEARLAGVGGGGEVQYRVAAVDDHDRVLDGGAPGQPGEPAVGPEAVVGVVGPDRRPARADDERLAREFGGQQRPVRGGGPGGPRHHRRRPVGDVPPLPHVLGEGRDLVEPRRPGSVGHGIHYPRLTRQFFLTDRGVSPAPAFSSPVPALADNARFGPLASVPAPA